jgi:hypothetical protein
MADFVMLSGTPGIYEPRTYLAGNMPAVEVGYSFNSRVGAHASFTQPFAKKHTYSDVFYHGYTQVKGWHASMGVDVFPFYKRIINPYLTADFNAGSFSIEENNTSANGLSNVTRITRGGYALGGSVAIGAQTQVFKNAVVSLEVNFTNMVYKPKEIFNPETGTSVEYSNDQTDTMHPLYGYIYVPTHPVQDYINMNFISFRAGFRYYLFMK